MTDTTVTNEPPQGNQPEARTPTGELKDQNPQSLTPSPSPAPKPEGGSFLTQEPKPEGDPKPAPQEGDPKQEVKEPKEGDAPQGAPDKYVDFKLPDGYKMDETASKEVTAMFKELNLSQDQAQKLVDYYGANLLKTAEAPYKAWVDTQKEWIGDIQERFGSKTDAVRKDINSAITNALPPSLARAFRTALDVTGGGSNPDIFEALSILARAHIEGKPVPAGGQSPAANKPPGQAERPSLADAMYPQLIPNRDRA